MFTYRQVSLLATRHGLGVRTALDTRLPTRATRAGALARSLGGTRAGRKLVEVMMSVVEVSLTKPGPAGA